MTVSAPRPSIGIIGTGRIAWSLAPALARAGYAVAAIGARESADANALAREASEATRGTTPAGVLEVAELVFLAVPDSAVGPLAATLPWTSHHDAVSCSGALPLTALSAATARGARPGCLHPLQSFPGRRAEPDRFRDITCGVEGAGPLGDRLAGIATDLGGRVVRLESVDRAAYHAAAVFASNDVVALMAAARNAWTLAGLPREAAREALAPLLRAVAENLARLDPEAALTGPIARGDVATVQGHLAVLAREPALAALYRQLALALLPLAPDLEAGAEGSLRRLLAD